MSADPTVPGQPADLAAEASAWLARRDRGLTPREQDEYLEWLRADPRHGAITAQLEKTWGALNALAEWRPAHSPLPNPDLLAAPPAVEPARAARWARVLHWPGVARALAAAALLAIGTYSYFWVASDVAPPAGTVRVIPPPERITLTDGSTVELNQGGKIETDFSAAVRRVRLVRGEAHFTVTSDPARPFIVDAGSVAVRAIGTAFDVRHTVGAVEVLVTHGKVEVERQRPVAPGGASEAALHTPAAAVAAPTPLVAGERAVVDTTVPAARPVVATVTPGEIAQALSWQGVRLEFAELALAEVVAEFNLRNRQQLVVADAATGRIRVGGSFRADNVEAFVRLLEASFGVLAERRADGTLALRREK